MHVILYVFDSLRADHVSCYGYGRETTPVIDSLAADGVVFEECIAPGTWTRPVAASILTGTYPPVHGTYRATDAFTPPTTPLAEALEDAGYDTLGVVSGNMHSDTGMGQGFGTYVDDIDRDVPDQAENTDFAGTRGREINRAFAEWLDGRDGDDPIFAMLWSTGPHYPYAPPEGFREYLDPDYDGPVDGTPECLRHVRTEGDVQQLRNYYDGEIRYNDHCIGNLIEDLRERGLYEDTLVVCVGDHGDGFGEHPGFLGHGSMVPYEGLVHVPFVARTPTDVAGERTDALVSLVDLYRTVLDVAGAADAVDEALVQGVSVGPALRGSPVDGHEFVYAAARSVERGAEYRAIRSTSWKFVDVVPFEPEAADADGGGGSADSGALRRLLGTARDKAREWGGPAAMLRTVLADPLYYYRAYRRMYATDGFLFDLDADPGEGRNLHGTAEGQEAGRRLRAELDAWLTECERRRRRAGVDGERFEASEDLRERLARLGYHDH